MLKHACENVILPTSAQMLEDMERALARLRAVQGSAVWREAAIESSAVLMRGVCGLLEALNAPRDLKDSEVRAKRFACVKVAELQLYHNSQVHAGRNGRDIYGALKPQIEEARNAFRERFLKSSHGVPDYLHEEIVRALAQNDATLLGPKYPGPLV
ncbi:MAG: hypothetical protein JO307_09390 [Bryobacterales bacterium]|nr:hypothetical protein [Bryobacterales bacterium]MBV9397938.1 hypothetical protein [Bryobacterales bacterium]